VKLVRTRWSCVWIYTGSDVIRELSNYKDGVDLAIVLGSGLSVIDRYVKAESRISYDDIPGLCPPTVRGHPGELLVTRIEGKRVFLFLGRTHLYEGFGWESCTGIVSVASRLGCKHILITQTAGSLSHELPVGVWMLASAIYGFSGKFQHTVTSIELKERRSISHRRLLSLNSTVLYRNVRKGAELAKVHLWEGDLFWNSGPCYETPSESRAIALLGGRAVTMSSLPEVDTASRLNLSTVCLSWITNHTTHIDGGVTDHDEVLSSGEYGAGVFLEILKKVVTL
jgi:purine-nucleoside phosphorylase